MGLSCDICVIENQNCFILSSPHRSRYGIFTWTTLLLLRDQHQLEVSLVGPLGYSGSRYLFRFGYVCCMLWQQETQEAIARNCMGHPQQLVPGSASAAGLLQQCRPIAGPRGPGLPQHPGISEPPEPEPVRATTPEYSQHPV